MRSRSSFPSLPLVIPMCPRPVLRTASHRRLTDAMPRDDAYVHSFCTAPLLGPPPPIDMNAVFENKLARDALTPMGITSENVAERYGISREDQDKMAVASHSKALKAEANGLFKDEIVPLTVTVEDKEGNESEITVTKDDGPRKGSTLEKLGKLRAAFKKGGTTTAGNSSQVSLSQGTRGRKGTGKGRWMGRF